MALNCRGLINCSSCIAENCIWLSGRGIHFHCRTSVVDVEFIDGIEMVSSEKDCMSPTVNITVPDRPKVRHDWYTIIIVGMVMVFTAMILLQYIVKRAMFRIRWIPEEYSVDVIELLSQSQETQNEETDD